MAPARPDHFVILVEDLLDATRDFESLGFIVTQGSVNGPFVNALIAFDDGTYLELAAVRWRLLRRLFRALRRTPVLDAVALLPDVRARFVAEWIGADEGWVDWAVWSEPPGALTSAAEARGVAMRRRYIASRAAPGEGTLRWHMEAAKSRNLPFAIADITPTDARVPAGPRRAHPGGAVGTRAVTIAVRDLAAATDAFTRYLGIEPSTTSSTETAFELGAVTVSLKTRHSADPAVDVRLRQGEGLASVALRRDAASDAAAQVLDLRRTRGAHLTA